MHAIVVATTPEPDLPTAQSLIWDEVNDLVPGPGEVLVNVAAAGVNRADLLQRQGLYPPPPGASQIIGMECSGTVMNLGEGVSTLSIGDEVCCLLSGGGYAEQVVVPVGHCLPVPAGVTLVDAAGLVEVACTVWSNLVMVGRLERGETLLVHGGGSGVGTMAIQIGRLLGAQVAVTAGSAAKLTTCSELGADICINYREQDFVEVLKTETAGHGTDVILDNMGAKYLQRNISALARDGRLIVIGMQGGVKAEIDLSQLLRKNASVQATGLRGRPTGEKAAICEAVVKHVWPWVEAGLVRPVIDRTLPITDAATAHQLLQDGQATGKIVLTI
ncbi:MAG: NAD(P)H-quinone oxidoreductase [Candidatus Nanopelagicales bacterium]|nr:NAD(P)H-quinone oxidoreductase [Candidatus Nanopelagicales bacterium]MDP4825365.1 NAD(P)H-quinone oxidoreductase [Candidatus Nanopelagicales bacterium]MDP4887635.1 NAD(P)H-quinone oxidoreductase [Candidatus Nanopelagicales bacterium]